MQATIVSDDDLLHELDRRIKSGILKLSKEHRVYGVELAVVVSLESQNKKIELTVV